MSELRIECVGGHFNQGYVDLPQDVINIVLDGGLTILSPRGFTKYYLLADLLRSEIDYPHLFLLANHAPVKG